MTVKLQLVPKPALQMKAVLGLKGNKGDTGDPATAGSILNGYLADVPEATLKGRPAGAGTGAPNDLTPSEAKAVLAITASDVSGLGALAPKDAVDTADITDKAATNAKLADMAQSTIKGRASGAGTGAPTDLTVAQVKAILALASADISDFTTAVDARIKTGSVVNSAYGEYTTNADLTANIPIDDTIPQITEGTQILSVPITTSAATSKVRGILTLGGSVSASGVLMAAVFADGGANAIRSIAKLVAAGNNRETLALMFEHAPGSAGSHTYTVRVGANTGTVRLNGITTVRELGGSQATSLQLWEIKA